MMLVGVDTECLKGCEDYENGCPAMIEGEWKVDEEFIRETLRGVVFLDDIIDVRYGRADEKRKYKCPDIVMTSPKVDVDGIQDSEEREAPRHAIDDDGLSAREELVDDSA